MLLVSWYLFSIFVKSKWSVKWSSHLIIWICVIMFLCDWNNWVLTFVQTFYHQLVKSIAWYILIIISGMIILLWKKGILFNNYLILVLRSTFWRNFICTYSYGARSVHIFLKSLTHRFNSTIDLVIRIIPI